tara:strand:- start:440 stop:577 length:138 start_codon:yes stop_codon:yes gene_type:complete
MTKWVAFASSTRSSSSRSTPDVAALTLVEGYAWPPTAAVAASVAI